MERPKTSISSEEMTQFLCLRTDIFNLIERSLKLDGHCKSYEGALSIHWPNYFEDNDGVMCVELACYVLGDTRIHQWKGKTLAEALSKMCADVERWEEDISRDEESEEIQTEQGYY